MEKMCIRDRYITIEFNCLILVSYISILLLRHEKIDGLNESIIATKTKEDILAQVIAAE